MKSAFNFLQNYFHFTRGERNGLLVLTVLMLVLSGVLWWSGSSQSDISLTLSPNFLADIERFRASSARNDSTIFATKQDKKWERYPSKFTQNTSDMVANEEVELFGFDPNTASVDDFVRLGLPRKTAYIIVKYRKSGGKFFKKEDLKRIYSLSADDYNRISPYIDLPEKIAKKTFKKTEKDSLTVPKTIATPTETTPKFVRKTNEIIELNTADSLQLLKISGIGPSFASRILKYKKRSGGFANKEQLKEIYGIDSLKFSQISPFITTNAEYIEKINLNTATFQNLARHPYTQKYARYILNYRTQHGDFKSLDDLLNIKTILPKDFDKMKPFLKIR